jgi:hypothetical protein
VLELKSDENDAAIYKEIPSNNRFPNWPTFTLI